MTSIEPCHATSVPVVQISADDSIDTLMYDVNDPLSITDRPYTQSTEPTYLLLIDRLCLGRRACAKL